MTAKDEEFDGMGSHAGVNCFTETKDTTSGKDMNKYWWVSFGVCKLRNIPKTTHQYFNGPMLVRPQRSPLDETTGDQLYTDTMDTSSLMSAAGV